MVQRQVPRPKEIFELMRFSKPDLNRKRRLLNRALTIGDLREIAKRSAPKSVFEYTDGGSEGEITLRRARQAFQDVVFNPTTLRDVSLVDPSTTVLGGPSALPFGIAPTGFGRLMHTEGEAALSRAAGAAGIPYSLSTFGTTSIQDVTAANPGGRNWYQLYPMQDREIGSMLIEQARTAGWDTLIITVDTAVTALRLKDRRNGFSVPPQLTFSTVLDALPHTRWWWDFLTTPQMEFSSLKTAGPTLGAQFAAAVNPSANYADIADLRKQWSGNFVVKGVQSVGDARRVADLGVDAIVLSNHGGRQLDRGPVPFHLLPDVVREVGQDLEVMLDTGITHGADIVAALALGARFTLVGRATLYGLMAAGQAGVAKAIEILSGEITRTMALLGVSKIEELEPGHVTQLRRLAATV